MSDDPLSGLHHENTEQSENIYPPPPPSRAVCIVVELAEVHKIFQDANEMVSDSHAPLPETTL